MMFLSRHHRPDSYEARRSAGTIGSGLLSASILCIAFGLAVMAAPELLAYLVATFFLIIGITLLSIWWNLRR